MSRHGVGFPFMKETYQEFKIMAIKQKKIGFQDKLKKGRHIYGKK